MATIIPANAKENTISMMKISNLQAKVESYQGVMFFLKKGF